jgi:hypothetical protein
MDHSTPIISQIAFPLGGLGFFSWSVVENLVHGDALLAHYYEIPAHDLARGVPVELILARITPGDRDAMAAKIHDDILSGETSSARYGVICPSGARRSLISFGRCLRDEDGVPSYYSGAVAAASDERLILSGDPLESHIRAAFSLASDQRRELTQRYLSSALRSLGVLPSR